MHLAYTQMRTHTHTHTHTNKHTHTQTHTHMHRYYGMLQHQQNMLQVQCIKYFVF